MLMCCNIIIALYTCRRWVTAHMDSFELRLNIDGRHPHTSNGEICKFALAAAFTMVTVTRSSADADKPA